MAFNLKDFESNIRQMEQLKHQHSQGDWEQDASDPMERSMVTKDSWRAKQDGSPIRGKYRNRGNNGQNPGRARGRGKRGGRRGYNNYNQFDRASSAGSERSFSSGGSFYSAYEQFPRQGNSYESDCMSDITSVSRQSSEITAPNLAKSLSEFPEFEATLLQLLDRFGYNHKHTERVVERNDDTFELEGETVRLRPKIIICPSHLSADGCLDSKACKHIHLCQMFVLGSCKQRDCIYGHTWHTDHNKRIFKECNLVYLPAFKLLDLFKKFILPSESKGDLKICANYNESECKDDKCSDLHLCLKNLAKQCTSGSDCKLDHSLSNEKTKSIVQLHGISLNESPRDILLSIGNCPLVKKSIEPLSRSTGNDSKIVSQTDDIKQGNESPKKKANNDESSVLNIKTKDEPITVAEKIPLKTAWSHEFKGEVTLNEICYKSVEEYCPFEESGCWRLHSNWHFYWQIRAVEGEKKKFWVNLTEDQVIGLEKAYCDPAVSKVELVTLDPSRLKLSNQGLILMLKGKSKWTADFSSMKLYMSGTKDVMDLRRLCTEDTNNETPAPCIFKWYFCDKNRTWIEYGNVDSTGKENLKSNVSSDDLEKHLHKRPNSPLSFQNEAFRYVLDMQNMCQTNLDTNVTRKARRRPVPHIDEKEGKTDDDKELPSNWEIMKPEDRYKRVTISPSSSEYQTLMTFIKGQGNQYNILKIERIQNPYLYKAFQIKVQRLKTLYNNDAVVNIQQLFHGTKPDVVGNICEENFDWRLHGSNVGQTYGRGTYFSPFPSTSYGYTSQDAIGHRFMFVAKVAVGTITVGNTGMTRPPINPQYNVLYDSTADKTQNPSKIVKYDKQEYFPEYLLTLA